MCVRASGLRPKVSESLTAERLAEGEGKDPRVGREMMIKGLVKGRLPTSGSEWVVAAWRDDRRVRNIFGFWRGFSG